MSSVRRQQNHTLSWSFKASVAIYGTVVDSGESTITYMNKLMKRIGTQLRLCREEKHISQGTLADAASVGKRTICAVENGQRNCSMAILNKLLDCLEISWPDFFARVEALPDDFEGDCRTDKKSAGSTGKKVTYTDVDLNS